LSTLYPVVLHRKARKIGYIRRERMCPKRTKLEAHEIPKNGEPVVFCAAV